MNYILLTCSYGLRHNTISFSKSEILWTVDNLNAIHRSPYTVGQFRNMPKYTGLHYVLIWEWV